MIPLLQVYLFVAIAVHQSLAVRVTSTGLQRTVPGKNCTFRWTVDEPITNYTIYNQTAGGLRTALDRYSYHEYDRASGVITLVLLNVQIRDVGNYTLELKARNTIITESTACLYLYGNLLGSVAITQGSNPANEGDAMELTCNMTLTSLPAPYRKDIHYVWYIPNYGLLRKISNGPAVLSNGDLVPGYAIKNNGRTLRISSVRYLDQSYFRCDGLEDGSSLGWSSLYYYSLSLKRYRPYPDTLYGRSKKLNVAIGKQVALYFYFRLNPSYATATNWTFTDTSGISRALPPGTYSNTYSYYSSFKYSVHVNAYLDFNLASFTYYGDYSMMIANDIGSTSYTFQVLPEGRPEQPSNVRLFYASHSSIAVRCNRQWSNSISPHQTVFFRLKLTESGVGVDLSSISYTSEAYNATITAYFTKNIQPEMDYTISIWSLNKFGSSDMVELKVRTRRQPKLEVSPDAISINGNQAVIDFTVEEGNAFEQIAGVEAQCCSVFSGLCGKFSGRYTGNQVAVDDIPDGTDYYIDLTIYGGIYEQYTYFSNSVRGLRASRNRNEDYGKDSLSAPKEIVIVLAVLLGIMSLGFIVVCALLCLTKRSRSSTCPDGPPMFPAEDFVNRAEMQRVRKGQNCLEVTPEDDDYYANADELQDEGNDYRGIQFQRRVMK